MSAVTGGAIVRGPLWALPLARMHEACFPPGERWDEEAMGDLLAMPGCFAALDTGAGVSPAGAATDLQGLALVLVAADEAELLTLAVLPAERRRGIGRRLLARAAGEAARLGARRLLLEVSVRNAAALRLYECQGFAPVGRRPRYYPDGSEALVLCRGLLSPFGSTPS